MMSESVWAVRRKKRLATGLCQDCGVDKEDKGRPTCERCRGLRRKAQIRKRETRNKKGCCANCNETMPFDREATLCVSCMGKVSERSRLRRKKIRQGVVEMYGGSCEECGEDHPATLSLHHVNGDGNKHRRELGIKSQASITIWRHVYNAHKNGGGVGYALQLLCFNCHAKKDLAPWWIENERAE